jgi:hypothetical protein
MLFYASPSAAVSKRLRPSVAEDVPLSPRREQYSGEEAALKTDLGKSNQPPNA